MSHPFLIQKSAVVQAREADNTQNNDIYGGRRLLIANIDRYYAGLELDTPEKKLARWSRNVFDIYYSKIIAGFKSVISTKDPHYVIPTDDSYIENVDLLGNSLNEYVTQIPSQVLKQGYCATINDYMDELNRPYLNFINPESFVSFRTGNNNGYPELTKFIYSEYEEIEDEENEFEIKLVKIHYVWDLDKNHEVRIRKYKRIETEDENNYQRSMSLSSGSFSQEDILIDTHNVIIQGKPLTKLPVIIHGQDSNNFTIQRSVLQDVSDLNISLYNRMVDLIEVLHLCAMPTVCVTGVDFEDPNVPTTIGPNKIWFFENSESVASVLEFSGKSFDAHMAYINHLLQSMAVQGAQILKQGGLSRETATSVLIRTGQETAIITDIVNNISSQVTEILKVYFEWYGKPTEDISYKLNSDFVNVTMEPNAQIALVKSWLDGAISHQTVFEKMKEGEIIASNKSFEQEQTDINSSPPPFFGKEKDAEISEQEATLSGSNMEIDNGTKNTEIPD